MQNSIFVILYYFYISAFTYRVYRFYILTKRLKPQSILLLLLDGGLSLKPRDLTLLLLKRLEPQFINYDYGPEYHQEA
jgi:hypothetical protein